MMIVDFIPPVALALLAGGGYLFALRARNSLRAAREIEADTEMTAVDIDTAMLADRFGGPIRAAVMVHSAFRSAGKAETVHYGGGSFKMSQNMRTAKEKTPTRD